MPLIFTFKMAPETRGTSGSKSEETEIEPYKLSEIFSLIPEFDGDQISLNTFLNSCDCANNMAVGDQKELLVIFI